MHGLAYDALIGFGGCDKTLPGVMMGMIRCNVPSIFIYGGSALPGRFAGKKLTVLDSYEAVGGFLTGEINAEKLEGIVLAPASSPPTPWRWCRRRWGSPCPTSLWCPAFTPSARRSHVRRAGW